MIRNHVDWSQQLFDNLSAHPDFEMITEPMLSLFSFRYAPKGIDDLDALNLKLITNINNDGRIYLTQTKIDGQFVIRFQCGSFDMEQHDMEFAYDVIIQMAAQL